MKITDKFPLYDFHCSKCDGWFAVDLDACRRSTKPGDDGKYDWVNFVCPYCRQRHQAKL